MAAGPLGFVIESHGDKAAARAVALLGKRGEDPRPAFAQMQDDLRAAEVEWYDSHGEGSWPHLDERTLENKQRQGYPPEPLVATGALRRSLTVKRGQKGIRSATKTRLRFGTRVPYAVFHQEARGVPQRRPLVPVDQRTRRKMTGDLRDHLLHRKATWR